MNFMQFSHIKIIKIARFRLCTIYLLFHHSASFARTIRNCLRCPCASLRSSNTRALALTCFDSIDALLLFLFVFGGLLLHIPISLDRRRRARSRFPPIITSVFSFFIYTSFRRSERLLRISLTLPCIREFVRRSPYVFGNFIRFIYSFRALSLPLSRSLAPPVRSSCGHRISTSSRCDVLTRTMCLAIIVYEYE